MSVKAINFERLDIGAHFKKSKTQYIWKFSLDSVMITIELVCSHLSGKKKVFKDGAQMFEVQKFGTSFQYPFQIGNHMLNIVQHGELFELRIDNQSFTHLYHQDRTKRAFVYEGAEENQEQEKSEQNNAVEQNRNIDEQNFGYGYGGYKKGHPDVKPDWQTQSNSYYNQRPQNKDDDFLWDDVKNAKSSIQTKQYSQNNYSDVRSKPYDDVLVSPQKNNENIEQNKLPPKQFDFNALGLPANAKKAQYINKPQQQTVNLLETDELKQKQGQASQSQSKTENFFNFENNFSNQAKPASSEFQFDLNQSNQQQDPSSFDFNFNAQPKTQPKAFDFNSSNPAQPTVSNQQVNVFDLLETSAQPKANVDDLMSVNIPQSSDLMKAETEQERKIKDLLQSGYTQPITLPTVLEQDISKVSSSISIEIQKKDEEKENIEKKLVNLDDLMGSKSAKNQQFAPIVQEMKQTNVYTPSYQSNNNIDPFAEAFQNSVKITQQQTFVQPTFMQPQQQKTDFAFASQQPSQANNDFFQGQQQTNMNNNQNDFFSFPQQPQSSASNQFNFF